MSSIYLSLLMTGATLSSLGVDPPPNHVLEAIPEGYHLYDYDDCGVEGRQPHVNMTDSYLYTFNPGDCAGTPNERRRFSITLPSRRSIPISIRRFPTF